MTPSSDKVFVLSPHSGNDLETNHTRTQHEPEHSEVPKFGSIWRSPNHGRQTKNRHCGGTPFRAEFSASFLDSASGTPTGWPPCLQTDGLRRTSCISCGCGYKKKLPNVKEQICKRHRCSTVCRNMPNSREETAHNTQTNQPSLHALSRNARLAS